MEVVITVLGRDRTGIIAGVTTCLAKEGVNIEGITQSVLDGNFVMMMTAQSKKTVEELRVALKSVEEALSVTINVLNTAVFNATQRV